MPSEIALLTKLTTLFLNNNLLFGFVPPLPISLTEMSWCVRRRGAFLDPES
jgi:hypothetical protein